MQEHPFQNPDLDTESRIDDLLSKMTLEEKIDCLGTNPSVPRLEIKGSPHVEGLHGLAQGGPANWTPPRKVPTTTFPQSYGLGATWNPDLIRRVARAEGIECRYIWQSPEYRQGGIVVRAPNADLGRDPRWGRTEECFGEDPFLTGCLTVAFVKGLQGDHPRYWLTASLMKHFLANSHENDRENTSSVFDERLWREYYAEPFRRGVQEGGSRAYMAAYNGWNGIPCHVHPMLKTITVNEWGQDGIICTDGGGLRLLVSAHKAFESLDEAAAAVIKAGVGQFLDNYKDAVGAALEKGLLDESDLDEVLRGTYRVMVKLGILDPPEQVPYSSIGGGEEPWLGEEHKALAREATLESIVLLKNDGLLPLQASSIKKVAVLGSRSDEVLLDWYSGRPAYSISPLEGIRGIGVEVLHSLNEEEAVRLAAEADVAIIVAGNHPTGNAGWAKVERLSDGKEAVDRESLELEDEAFIQRIYAANPRTVLVLTSSFPYSINWSQEHLPAILHMAHNSQEQGSALADVLFGHYNPAGRLTQTWPKSIDDLPPMMDYDLRNGRTYMYSRTEPLYEFGFGLSYSRFRYRNLRLSQNTLADDEKMSIAVDVENIEGPDGDDVVQLYVVHLHSRVDRPLKSLKGFQRVRVPAGETRTVVLTLAADQLRFWDTETKSWTMESGLLEVQVGKSSQDIQLSKTIRICGGLD